MWCSVSSSAAGGELQPHHSTVCQFTGSNLLFVSHTDCCGAARRVGAFRQTWWARSHRRSSRKAPVLSHFGILSHLYHLQTPPHIHDLSVFWLMNYTCWCARLYVCYWNSPVMSRPGKSPWAQSRLLLHTERWVILPNTVCHGAAVCEPRVHPACPAENSNSRFYLWLQTETASKRELQLPWV